MVHPLKAVAPNFPTNIDRLIPLFTIRLERNVIVLKGPKNEAADGVVKGTVVLLTSESISVKHLRLKLVGRTKIGYPWATNWPYTTATRPPPAMRPEVKFLKEEKELLLLPKSGILEKGNHEYSFEFTIPGSTPESIEGLMQAWIIYRLKATLERGGLNRNERRYHMVRVVRTPNLDPLQGELRMNGQTRGKLAFDISVPTRAIPFGTSIPTSIKLTASRKGFRLTEGCIMLWEHQEYSHEGEKTRKHSWIPANDDIGVDDEPGTVNERGEEEWSFKRTVPLPVTLCGLIQDVDEEGIRITHQLQFTIMFIQPNGKADSIIVEEPVVIFISPNLMVDEKNKLIHSGLSVLQIDQGGNGNGNGNSPPDYENHQLDRLWSKIDVEGYATPAEAISGGNSPSIRSRNESVENLGSLDGLSQHAVPAHALYNRLDNVRNASGGGLRRLTPIEIPTPTSRIRRGISEDGSTIIEVASPLPSGLRREISGDDIVDVAGSSSREGTRATETDEVEVEEIDLSQTPLSKVPSYQTTASAPVRPRVSAELPSYEDATGNTVPRQSLLETNVAAASVSGEGSASSSGSPLRGHRRGQSSGSGSGNSRSLRDRIFRFGSR
ncbi:MAG: Ubiquitin fusion degradation protein 4 [Watsoniomyces obsoletus]|nr:MAG: Ubiquitin fusion degradation protein 4 [Watsoniomyces obsoletus]